MTNILEYFPGHSHTGHPSIQVHAAWPCGQKKKNQASFKKIYPALWSCDLEVGLKGVAACTKTEMEAYASRVVGEQQLKREQQSIRAGWAEGFGGMGGERGTALGTC